jgi:hypothetical protein
MKYEYKLAREYPNGSRMHANFNNHKTLLPQILD